MDLTLAEHSAYHSTAECHFTKDLCENGKRPGLPAMLLSFEDALNMSFWNRMRVMAIATLVALLGLVWVPQAQALPQGNAIKDPKALLRYSLPIDNKTVRELQGAIEDVAYQLRAVKRWGPAAGDLKKADLILTSKRDKILTAIPEAQQPQADALMTQIQERVVGMKALVEAQDKEGTLVARKPTLDLVGDLEALMVQGFPYEVPAEYNNLPQLKGRATVEFKTTQGDLKAVIDGYSAPVTGGVFVDLVQRKFYDNMPFNRAEEFYVLQTGDPKGPEDGFVDPKTKKLRTVPLEILAQGDKVPTYGITFEDAGRPLDQPVLPFSSFGAMAWARPNEDANGGSSQFFFFLFEPELTPAGINLLDGRYAIFGYVTEGNEILGKLKLEDKILSARVISGAENFQKPTA
jgi:peptidylprolyl isomerase